ncbi:MAG: hypothetical protein WD342_10065 [Verrucomicrobiales bacterium]
MNLQLVVLLVALAPACKRSETPRIVIEKEPSVESLVSTVLNGGGTFRDVEFAGLVESSTGNLVIPVNPADPVDAEILACLDAALTTILNRFNQPDTPTNSEKRINEVSSYFEEALLEELDAAPELSCEYPRTAKGNLQRAGYPDLMIRHLASGRVAYLDPKLVKQGTLDSSLRTFYFTPRNETNKILRDAHHLLVGVEHDGNTGDWQFLRWHVIDLTRFQVTLKAEFQASNRDIYIRELLLETGEP